MIKTLLYLLILLISFKTFSVVEYNKLIGSLSIDSRISLIKGDNGNIYYEKYNPQSSNRNNVILRKFNHSALIIKGAHSTTYLVFGKDNEKLKLGYLWDLKRDKPVDLSNWGTDSEIIGLRVYALEWLKTHYEVRYLWYTPEKGKDKFYNLNYTFSSRNGVIPEMRFSQREKNIINIYSKPNGKILQTVNQQKIAELRVDSRIYEDVSTLYKMNFTISSVKMVNGIAWAKISLPAEKNTEISYDKTNEKGQAIVHFEFIDYKQSIFKNNVYGWIKLFDKNNRLQVRYSFY